MTQGRSHMERNVTKFSLPSITGRITTSLKKRRKDVVQLPNITGRVTKSCKTLQLESITGNSSTPENAFMAVLPVILGKNRCGNGTSYYWYLNQ